MNAAMADDAEAVTRLVAAFGGMFDEDAVRAELADCGGDESVAKTNLTERAFSKKRGGPGEPKPKHLAPGFFRGRGRDDSMTRVEIEETLTTKQRESNTPPRRRRSLAGEIKAEDGEHAGAGSERGATGAAGTGGS